MRGVEYSPSVTTSASCRPPLDVAAGDGVLGGAGKRGARALKDRFERFVLDLHQRDGRFGRVGVDCRNRHDRLARVAHPVDGQDRLVASQRTEVRAEPLVAHQVSTRHHRHHTCQRQRAGRVNRNDPRVRKPAPHQPPDQRACLLSIRRIGDRSPHASSAVEHRHSRTYRHTLVSVPDSVAFVQPDSLEQAVESLEAYGEDAKIVAGATALTIMLRQRLIRPAALISLGRLGGLNRIERQDGHLRIGALATHRQVELSPVVKTTIPMLAETFSVVANVRVRNAATVGGVLAEADYASDPPAVFMALDAEVEAFGPRGPRTIRVQDFFKGFYETALEPNEIVTGVRIPVP